MLDKKQGQLTAYLPSADPDQLAETLVAMANADGGIVVLGLNEDGSFAEEIWEEEATSALQLAIERCNPPVMAQWEMLQTRRGDLVSLRVARSADLHTLSDGRILVRHNTDNRPISGAELIQLATRRTVGNYESDSVAGATIDDFDRNIVKAYLDGRKERGNAYVGSREQLYFEIGATNHAGNPTVMGILLFGKNPQMFMPQSGVVFVSFDGLDPRGINGRVGYTGRTEINGSLAQITERTWNVVYREMRTGARLRGLRREEESEYPVFAVREAIINAIAHRDYRIAGRKIEIRMYDDRLEVISPGGLAGHMTLDNLVEEHYSRNPRIVNGLFQWGYIEELGLGIDQMMEQMNEAGHPPPKFDVTNEIFTVTLSNARVDEERKPRGMNERQVIAINYVKKNGSITNADFRRECADISAETLRRDLADLVRKGKLLKLGMNKGTYYILNS